MRLFSFFPSKALACLLLSGICFAVDAQDTRGSLVPTAKVLLADGTTRDVQDLEVSDLLWAWLPEGKAGTARVTAVRRQNTDSFLLLKVGDQELRATGAHRVATATGKLVRLDTVKPGDKLWTKGPNGPIPQPVGSLRLFPATMVAYDLTVEGHRPFVVDGVVVGD